MRPKNRNKRILIISLLCGFIVRYIFLAVDIWRHRSQFDEKKNWQYIVHINDQKNREIDTYLQDFVDLYTSNALEDTENQLIIEEREFLADNGNSADIIKYSDLSGNCLRYELHYYGETGNRTVNYYMCEDFYWINDQRNHYSSWIYHPEYSNVLYSEVANWIVMYGTVYSMHDSGELEKMQEAPSEMLLLEDIESYWEENY